jgi:hypothetical protein
MATKTKKPAPKAVAKAKPKMASRAKAARSAAPHNPIIPKSHNPATLQRRSTDKPKSTEQLLTLDAGYQQARSNAATYLHSRRQAAFALARRYHLDADDLMQEGYEILLTCLRDFQPLRKNDETGETATVQFNTFFGARLEGKAMELRNRDPEYQARQAHTADMTDEERDSFRKNPPLLVQHLDQETTMQEHLQSEVSGAQRARTTNVRQKVLQDSYIDRKLTELIAAERDDQRRAALLQVKVGGLSTFDDIAYHFGVTDSRASQILNDLMDAFYVQRLLDGDLKSVAYDFRKIKMADKRALRLLAEAINNAPPPRAQALTEIFMPDYPDVATLLAARSSVIPAKAGIQGEGHSPQGIVLVPADQPEKLFTPLDINLYPPVEVGWRETATLAPHTVTFRSANEPAEPAHITRLMASGPEHWPLIVAEQGVVIDGVRRLAAARAKNIDRVLCHVHKMAEPDAAIMRIVLNMRAIRPEKLDLYFAIAALLKQGLSQGKVAAALNTSRPNVIVYAKVAEKAAPELRQLFEEGLIQVTNASACADLPAGTQSGIARAIRTLGPEWSKGPKFTDMFSAAESGKLEKYLKTVGGDTAPPLLNQSAPQNAAFEPQSATSASLVRHPAATSAQANQQISGLQNALVEAETWATRRDATIAQQISEINDLKDKVSKLSSELEAAHLLSQADQSTIQAYLKELKLFHGVTERLQAASHHIQQVVRPLRSLQLTMRQSHEIQEICESIASQLTALRLALQRTPGQ